MRPGVVILRVLRHDSIHVLQFFARATYTLRQCSTVIPGDNTTGLRTGRQRTYKSVSSSVLDLDQMIARFRSSRPSRLPDLVVLWVKTRYVFGDFQFPYKIHSQGKYTPVQIQYTVQKINDRFKITVF